MGGNGGEELNAFSLSLCLLTKHCPSALASEHLPMADADSFLWEAART